MVRARQARADVTSNCPVAPPLALIAELLVDIPRPFLSRKPACIKKAPGCRGFAPLAISSRTPLD